MAHELNLDIGPDPQDEMLSDISIFSTSGFSVHNRGDFCAALAEGIVGKNLSILFLIWASG